MFKSYREAYGYFYGKRNHFIDMGLDNIRSFLKAFGSPEDSLNIIQVAGTNGKGSLSVMLDCILRASGFRVGRYSSPAVFDERENITVDGEPISEEDFVIQVNAMYKAMETSQKQGRLPTVFELETAMAFLYFLRQGCDIVILEAGMGGAADATNVSSRNLMAVITSVSLDHTAYLGETAEEIAHVKAGIIKAASVAVIGVNRQSVTDIIRERAELLSCRFAAVRPEKIAVLRRTLEGQTVSYRGIRADMGMVGEYQAENAALAIEASYALRESYSDSFKTITDSSIRAGIEAARLKGRFQKLSDEPLVIIDGAHNPGAALRLKENIDIYLKDYSVAAVVGIFKDKDYDGIIKIMSPYLKRCVAVDAYGERSLSRGELRRRIERQLKADIKLRQAGADTAENKSEEDIEVKEAEDYREAINTAAAMAREYGAQTGRPPAVVVFGSLSYLKYIAQEADRL